MVDRPGPPRSIDAVVFDCDGVLFDSAGANIAFFDAALARAGYPPLDATGRELALSLSTHQLVDRLFAGAGERDAVRAAAQALDYEPFYQFMTPVPGLHELLSRLRREYRLGMATNRGKTAHEVARRFELVPPLECVVGVLEVERPKPHPEMLLRCAESLGSDPCAVVYVGDQEGDRAAAEAAGMAFVGVGEAPRADVKIGALAELPAALARCEDRLRRGRSARASEGWGR